MKHHCQQPIWRASQTKTLQDCLSALLTTMNVNKYWDLLKAFECFWMEQLYAGWCILSSRKNGNFILTTQKNVSFFLF